MSRKKAVAATTRCGDCAHVTIVTDFHTLSVSGQPTMGRCPYYSDRYCVLLSGAGCDKFTNKQ